MASFFLLVKVSEVAAPGTYPLTVLPLLDENSNPTGSFLDKQENPMSISLVSQKNKYNMTGGWSGVYQEMESSDWQQQSTTTWQI